MIAVVVSSFNRSITDRLLARCLEELGRLGLKKNRIKIFRVPGAFELPFAASEIARSRKYGVIIALGCVIKGSTSHDYFISQWASVGLGLASLLNRVPVVFGVLTPKNERQALVRSSKGSLNRGKEAARTAVSLLKLKRDWR